MDQSHSLATINVETHVQSDLRDGRTTYLVYVVNHQSGFVLICCALKCKEGLTLLRRNLREETAPIFRGPIMGAGLIPHDVSSASTDTELTSRQHH